MKIQTGGQEQLALCRDILKWFAMTLPLGLAVGSACALFLWSLERATQLQFQHPWLLWLLPVAGASIGWLYSALGQSVEKGNNLILEEIHEPGAGISLRMVPLVLVGTLITHLFGGSAGREGTAVQMGGSLASGLARSIPGFSRGDTRMLLMAGIAAGFSGVFGTPVAAAIFALEVLAIGRMHHSTLLACLIASIVSDWTCTAWGIAHTHYHLSSQLPAGSTLHLAPFDGRLLACAVLGGILFGLASLLFAELMHGLHWLFKRSIRWSILRPVVGGCLVIALTYALGTRDYLGLGISSPDAHAVTIVSSFHAGGAHFWSWWWKIVFTVLTLSSGFKGGEVTPLFFIGAALGNTIAILCDAPVDLFAALGFVSVFAGATNTPIACTIMAVELFGGEYIVYFATSCVLAYLFSGHSGIYLSQRVSTSKLGSSEAHPETSLRAIREAQP